MLSILLLLIIFRFERNVNSCTACSEVPAQALRSCLYSGAWWGERASQSERTYPHHVALFKAASRGTWRHYASSSHTVHNTQDIYRLL